MNVATRIINVVMNRVDSRSRLDATRTLFAKLGMFFPVSKQRWVLAQKFESLHYKDVINNVPVKKTETLLRHYSGPGAHYFKKTIEQTLDLDLSSYLDDKILIDIACGASSVFLDIQTPVSKIGIDPMNFSEWVIARYEEIGAKIIPMCGEDFKISIQFDSIGSIKQVQEVKVVIFTNALQHFRSLDQFFLNLQNQLGAHELLFLEFLNVPADRAHPQILTIKRLNSYIEKFNYKILNSKILKERLIGFIERGNGLEIEMYLMHASKLSQ